MDSIDLKGPTLKKKQEAYNKLVTHTINNKVPFESVEKIKTLSDIDSLFKIDIASEYQNVDYILGILQSDDMLLISRAIKRSTWLINGEDYVHIINPTYLEKTLFPKMMPKAICKFTLAIRLKLNDEKRVDEFFNHYKESDISIAMKWLPKCSVPKILDAIKDHYSHIDEDLFKRLCRRSGSVFEAFYSISLNKNVQGNFFNDIKYLLQSNPKLLMDVYEKYSNTGYLKLGRRTTKHLLKYNLEYFVNNFEKYTYTLHMPTFAKTLGKEKVKDFIVKQSKNEKIRRWFRQENLTPFLRLIPKSQEKFEFMLQIFAEKSDPPMEPYGAGACSYKPLKKIISKTSSIYKMYKNAPFNIAYAELQKIIRTESSMEERGEMLSLMLLCAGHNNANIKTVLNYFVDKHINEPAKVKLKFAYTVVDNTQTQNYDKEMWEILQQIFYSLEVYNTATNSNVTKFAEAIAIYLVLHEDSIPEVIEKRIGCSSFRDFKLNEQEKIKVFEYCYQLYFKKLENIDKADNTNHTDSAKAVEDVLRVLKYWGKVLSQYPIVMKKTKMLVRTDNKNNLSQSIRCIINSQKSWHKHFFEESLILWPTEESCLNALKHDPQLLTHNDAEVNKIKEQGEAHPLLLRKLRIYWYKSVLYNDWLISYRNRLEKYGEQNASIRGMFRLLPREDLVDLIKGNVPKEDKIKWSETDEIQLGRQKGIAKYMPLIRPQIPLEFVIFYLRGDYIPFANTSYAAILYNQPSATFRTYLDSLLAHRNKNVEKQGLRAAFAKLDLKDLIDTFTKIWKRVKNISIRAVIFYLTFKMMCDNKNPNQATCIWNLLRTFMDELSTDTPENSSIYEILANVESVPRHLQPEFLKRSYEYFVSLKLPDLFNYDDKKDHLIIFTENLMESMDSAFMNEILQDYIRNLFEKLNTTESYALYNKRLRMCKVIVSFILCVQKEEIQIERYESVFLPILRHVRDTWNNVQDQVYLCRRYFIMLLTAFSHQVRTYVDNGQGIMPVKLYACIKSELETGFPNPENFTMIANWSIATDFMQRLEKVVARTPRETNSDPEKDDRDSKYWDKLISSMTQDIAELITETTDEHLKRFFPSITVLLPAIIRNFFSNFQLYSIQVDVLKLILESNLDKPHMCIMITDLVVDCNNADDARSKQSIHQILSTHHSIEVRTHYYVQFPDPLQSLNENHN